jgi:hypothetical protein
LILAPITLCAPFCKFFFQILYNAEGEETREIEAKWLLTNHQASVGFILVDLLARFYEAKSSMGLERKYIRYGEESISKFQMEMR